MVEQKENNKNNLKADVQGGKDDRNNADNDNSDSNDELLLIQLYISSRTSTGIRTNKRPTNHHQQLSSLEALGDTPIRRAHRSIWSLSDWFTARMVE